MHGCGIVRGEGLRSPLARDILPAPSEGRRHGRGSMEVVVPRLDFALLIGYISDLRFGRENAVRSCCLTSDGLRNRGM